MDGLSSFSSSKSNDFRSTEAHNLPGKGQFLYNITNQESEGHRQWRNQYELERLIQLDALLPKPAHTPGVCARGFSSSDVSEVRLYITLRSG